MREMIDTIITVEKSLSQDPLVKVTEKLGYGAFYKKAVLNDLIKSPNVQIDGNILTIHESYSNNSLFYDLKNLGHETLETAKYIAGHPKDIAHITYDVAKGVLTNPKALTICLLGIAIGGSGCLISTDNTATTNDIPDVHIKAPADEKVVKTTPDGLNFYEKESDLYVTNTYRGAYDTDGDGKINVKDSAIDQPMADQYDNGNIKKTIKGIYGIPIDSKMYQDHPEVIKEIRVRQTDLDGDGKFK